MSSAPTSRTAPHTHTVRVYWEDTDAGGIVYHASHIRFFERGRTELLRSLGVRQSATADRSADDALLFTVRRMEVDYLKPAVLDDLLTVETSVKDLGGSRVTLLQRLVRGDDLVAEAVVVVVAVGGVGRPKRIPPELRSRFVAMQ
ncbi:tol-pal system-associated acyl-CoA thioesterase [Chthonobacter rhizosphaerae]|uniref:tol-pal system-associated acyl-CoA thioesterase n=1 Tax=Chthonobacter rhizosphaerae TaxID=2735553 RepID=UPI0015EF7E40|nr:tol-pal system-associated acyl-CoA thioesterase [Chthonobacter rhizosphaerae]